MLLQNSRLIFELLENGKLPTRGTQDSAGYDLYATADTTIVGGNGNYLVKTGVKVKLPIGTYGRIAMRSGLAVKEHLSVSAGVIDRDYTGEVGVVVFCTKNNYEYTIKAGERFAQLVPEMVWDAPNSADEQKLTSEKTHDGFGSTGRF